MLKKNLSAEETIKCICCPNSGLRVPELEYNICEKRIGIIPTSLKMVLDKRAKYKELNNDDNASSSKLAIYKTRQSSLKWILVTSFGYLGFNNAKFGRIDATGNNVNEVKTLMPKVKDTFDKYVRLLKENDVRLEELVFTKRLSKNSNNYQHRNTIEINALMKLNNEGKFLSAGEVLQYIITDYYQTRTKNNRAIPVEIIDKSTVYDVRRYTELLTQTCNSVTEPFGLKL
jgi:DNA polymerase elongation subunit (family B)